MALVLALAPSVVLVAGDARGPVFRAGVDAVLLAVTVTDGRGQFVSDLGAADFEVLEDGVPQRLSHFTHERLPVSLAVLLDTSASMKPRMEEARAAAQRFLAKLGPGDTAQLVGFNDRAYVLQEFTDDHELLAAALRSARPRGATALYNAIYGSLQELDRQRREGELRRLAVVVLSDGTDTASVITDDQVRELARRKEIGVYGVALRSPDQDAVQPDRLNPGLATFFMAALTRETGGQAHFVRSVADLRHVYDRVAEELRSQYAMGYVSSNPRHDGKWRRIVLRTPTRPGLHVRHRIGYYAPPS